MLEYDVDIEDGDVVGDRLIAVPKVICDIEGVAEVDRDDCVAESVTDVQYEDLLHWCREYI